MKVSAMAIFPRTIYSALGSCPDLTYTTQERITKQLLMRAKGLRNIT